jgi:probable F420-dependent oxidoreductase
MAAPRLVAILSESSSLVDPRDLRGLVRLASVLEDGGIDAVMLSEHVVLGPTSDSAGVMANPRDYAAPGNQSPSTAWPSSIVLLSAMAQATSRLRLVAGAIIAPLRHPLLLAKELATLDLLAQGRLIVLPTVSWHRDEYDALGVPFGERGRILDEQLAVLEQAWSAGPISHHGHYFDFAEVWCEPRPYRPQGPAMWFGGQGMHAPLLRRLVRYGSGFNPFGPVTDEELGTLDRALREAGRDPGQLERVGGIRARFPDDGVADLGAALEGLAEQVERGFTTICVKPAMFLDDAAGLPAFCRRLVREVAAAVPGPDPAATRVTEA